MVNPSMNAICYVLCETISFRRYKWLFIISVGLLGCFFSLPGDANDDGGHIVNIIHLVDHKRKEVIINDRTHIMLIGLKVYIYEQRTDSLRKVNRYALKKGQSVYYTTEVRKSRSYVSKITILP